MRPGHLFSICEAYDIRIINKKEMQKSYNLKNVPYLAPDFKSLLVKPREEMWYLLKEIISRASDLDTINAKSTSEIITLLGKGKISIDEAIKLMKLLQTKQDIDELPKLIAAMEKLESN